MPRKPTGTCTVSWCDKPSIGRFCNSHWSTYYKYGSPTPAEAAHFARPRYHIRLLAKTCTKCGELRMASEYQNNGCRISWCRSCMADQAYHERNYDPVKARAASQRWIDERQKTTLRQAKNWGKHWTAEEDRLVMDESQTMEEKAVLLGRSYKAVEDRIFLIRHGKTKTKRR